MWTHSTESVAGLSCGSFESHPAATKDANQHLFFNPSDLFEKTGYVLPLGAYRIWKPISNFLISIERNPCLLCDGAAALLTSAAHSQNCSSLGALRTSMKAETRAVMWMIHSAAVWVCVLVLHLWRGQACFTLCPPTHCQETKSCFSRRTLSSPSPTIHFQILSRAGHKWSWKIWPHLCSSVRSSEEAPLSHLLPHLKPQLLLWERIPRNFYHVRTNLLKTWALPTRSKRSLQLFNPMFSLAFPQHLKRAVREAGLILDWSETPEVTWRGIFFRTEMWSLSVLS